jgi:hypothetical protein
VALMAMFTALLGAPGATAEPDVAYVHWHNGATGRCFAPTGDSMTNGTKIIQVACNYNNPAQLWLEIPLEAGNEGGYLVRNKKNPNKCLSVPNNWTSPGVQLHIWDCQSASGQLWDAIPLGRPYFALENNASGRLIAVAGGSETLGTPIIQWSWSGTAEQRWYSGTT